MQFCVWPLRRGGLNRRLGLGDHVVRGLIVEFDLEIEQIRSASNLLWRVTNTLGYQLGQFVHVLFGGQERLDGHVEEFGLLFDNLLKRQQELVAAEISI